MRYIRKHAVPLRELLYLESVPLLGPGGGTAGGAGGGAGGGEREAGRGRGSTNPSRASITSMGSSGKGSSKGRPGGGGSGGEVLRLEGGTAVTRVPGVGIYYNELLTGKLMTAGGRVNCLAMLP